MTAVNHSAGTGDGATKWPLVLRPSYKAALYGRQFRKVGRFEPTSQVCSACEVKDGPKPLSVREWTCKECGTTHAVTQARLVIS